MPIKEIHLNRALEEMKLTVDQFIDLCILLGCDYCDSIKGIGPVRAFELIKKYGSLEEIIENLDTKKYPIPENFDFVAVRKLFKEPEVMNTSQIELKWTDPDEDGLLRFLVNEKGFSEERVKNGIVKLKKSRATSVQDRLTSYFGPIIVKRKNEACEQEKLVQEKSKKTPKKSKKSKL